ncbi:MAG TPA: hypothetical protein VHK65_09320 [Candidatus Dormibacteraeota bacterium]|nr:hypothetical protein [Candidatus Dormibacteraeota bacterium]
MNYRRLGKLTRKDRERLRKSWVEKDGHYMWIAPTEQWDANKARWRDPKISGWQGAEIILPVVHENGAEKPEPFRGARAMWYEAGFALPDADLNNVCGEPRCVRPEHLRAD